MQVKSTKYFRNAKKHKGTKKNNVLSAFVVKTKKIQYLAVGQK